MSLFIEDVMKKIWEPVTAMYKEVYDNAMSLSEEELFQLVEEEIKLVNSVVLQSKGLNMTMLATSGCPHNNRNGVFSGCSMCDYNSRYVKQLALMGALKEKDTALYARASRFSFDNSRGKTPKPGVVELISAHDCLNSEEIPEQVFEEIFGKNDLFTRKPYKTIFETRISSITYEGLMKWKEKLGKKVVVEFGIEVYNDWVRNHWINKNVSERSIHEAFRVMKETDCESSANILIGVPGLTEEYSLLLFKDSFFQLCELGADYILCSPLSRKQKTLQGYIYEHLRENSVLKKKGLVSGAHTGIPSLFTVYEAVCSVLEERPDEVKRLTLSPTNFPIYFEQLRTLYRDYPQSEEISEYIIKLFKLFNQNKNIDELFSGREVISRSESYKYYIEYKVKQKEAGNLKQIFEILAKEIAESMYYSQSKAKLDCFYKELNKFSFVVNE